VGQADGAAVAHSSQPLHLHKAGKQSCSDGASDMVMALGPIQTLVSKGTPEPAEWIRINVECTQKLFSRGREYEFVFPMAERTTSQQFVSKSNREDACEVIIACPGKSYFRHSGNRRGSGEGSQRFNGGGDVGVLETEKALPTAAF
jgi:hypothetical protein